jgi:hypothetical protein
VVKARVPAEHKVVSKVTWVLLKDYRAEIRAVVEALVLAIRAVAEAKAQTRVHAVVRVECNPLIKTPVVK